MSQPQHNGLTHIQMLEHQLKKQYPQSTQEQITAMISQTLKAQQQKQGIAQSAMNAAAGAVAAGNMGVGQGGTPQAYAQMLRQHTQAQAQQQASSAVSNGQGQVNNGGSGNAGQSHAHRGSSGSVQSGK
jgi:chromatin modification-related protein VID21